jgi:dTDP-4-dehydrorhamnose reductase
MLVITGASGLLGASLLLHARDLGKSAAGICHRNVLRVPGATIHAVDLTDQRAACEVLTDLRPSWIIHCAAATNVDWCEEHPGEAEQINTRAAAFLAGLARELTARLVYISTDAVFDGRKGNYSEDDQPSPVNAYARSKLFGEREVLRLCPSALVVRVNIYGWNAQMKLSLAEWMLEQLAAGNEVPGFTDVHFTPMLVNDLAEILLTMLDCDLAGIYHVGGSSRVSKFEFARRVASIFGFRPEQVQQARATEAGLRALRPPDTSLNSGRVSSALGRLMPDVDSGLRKFRALRDAGYPQQLKTYLGGSSR